MWISKLKLDLRSKAVRRDLASPYEMHRTLSRAVSQALKEGKERLLWRLEPTRGTEPPVVLVQTLTLPDWDALEKGYAEVYPPKPFQPALREGQILRFRLRANPSKRARDRGERIALKTREEKLVWLVRKFEEGGFRLREEGGQYLAAIRQDTFLEIPKAGHLIQVQAVLFEGVLVVVDPAKALETLKRGIGPGKALGLGLLSLHP
ncbi:type I-E CRISPR-associated protein Cas6/Cse3/CasE [Thermus scotoductus]|jgi:CRISPR system Cascade subunit CasE|uniref:CRISPR-associated protein Cse3 n=2 Tax=Thermus scotoductus TaxID=37636 RepID=A0A0N0ZPW3_THESC|nr:MULTISPECIES: type I-E CRISPR-associated protein Cas6/Cse3/CasE [Thermus]ADW21866.1 crispr-associated protein, Cse3 family [Thermus scotoductus SA-01]KPD32372.1 CRISPR-associated protein Cse3 [Thermus scotoductus]RTG93008.1 type I-E CRISPR-associated protein Cas6/Cse3/CasE [Thermus scotoductus]RTH00935.1 type I-E CRISPR-associated protein Cas6/Cse3/CasE [Thermus scotoductus]RTH02796.1 type I-E CRISPR-associated protein Cas6/Cse3/CasE [Thermus scotoductus]